MSYQYNRKQWYLVEGEGKDQVVVAGPFPTSKVAKAKSFELGRGVPRMFIDGKLTVAKREVGKHPSYSRNYYVLLKGLRISPAYATLGLARRKMRLLGGDDVELEELSEKKNESATTADE